MNIATEGTRRKLVNIMIIYLSMYLYFFLISSISILCPFRRGLWCLGIHLIVNELKGKIVSWTFSRSFLLDSSCIHFNFFSFFCWMKIKTTRKRFLLFDKNFKVLFIHFFILLVYQLFSIKYHKLVRHHITSFMYSPLTVLCLICLSYNLRTLSILS
jgi:hypothetical protein